MSDAAQNGHIQFPNNGDTSSPATLPEIRQENGKRFELDKLDIKEGEGPHPIVRITMPAMILGELSISMLGTKNFTTVISPETENEQPEASDAASDGLMSSIELQFSFLHEMTKDTFLSSYLFEDAYFYGTCIAANEHGPLAIHWDVSDPDRVSGWRALNMQAEGGITDDIVAIVPKNMPLALPGEHTILVAEDGKLFEIKPKLFEFSTIGLASVNRATLMLAAGQLPTTREQALLDMGIESAEYNGERPSGIKYLPKEPTPA